MEERAHRRRIWAENAAIFFLGAFALFLFCVSFFPSLAAAQRVQASLEMGRMVERAFSVALFFLATRLYRRLRAAHTAAMAVFVLHLLRGLTAGRAAVDHGGGCDFAGAVFPVATGLPISLREDGTEEDRPVCPSGGGGGASQRGPDLSPAAAERRAGDTHRSVGQLCPGRGHDLRPGGPVRRAGGMGTLLFWFSWCCILAALALALRPWMQGQAVQAGSGSTPAPC